MFKSVAVGFMLSVSAMAAEAPLTAQQADELRFLADQEAAEIEMISDGADVLGLDHHGRRGPIRRIIRGAIRGTGRVIHGAGRVVHGAAHVAGRVVHGAGHVAGHVVHGAAHLVGFPHHRHGWHHYRWHFNPHHRAWYHYGYYPYPAGTYPGYSYGYHYAGNWRCLGYSEGEVGGLPFEAVSSDYNAAYESALSSCQQAGKASCVVSCERQCN